VVLLPFVGYAISYTVTYAADIFPAYYLSAHALDEHRRQCDP
jgi:hypothetical protein